MNVTLLIRVAFLFGFAVVLLLSVGLICVFIVIVNDIHSM